MKINIADFLIFDMIIVIVVVSLMTFLPIKSPDAPLIHRGDVVCPPLEGGSYWTICVDNLSTPENEMFVIWEGYEGDYMDANIYIPHENNTYHITYYGTDGKPKFNLTLDTIKGTS